MNTLPVLEQIEAAIVALLGGNAAGVWDTRLTPFGPEELPADNLIPEDEQPDWAESDTDSVEVKAKFTLRHTAAAVNGAKDQAAARYLRAARLIEADPTLGGLVHYTRYMGRKWERERAETDTIACVATYEIQFSTTRIDPGAAGY